jgi:gluconate 2-dehydrogenase gamma chain
MFLRAAAAAGAAWAAVDLLQVEEALAWTAQHPAHGNRPAAAIVRVLTQEQAATLDAMSARILPAVDGRAGAHEAGVVYFIDRSLATFNASQKTFYADGVTDLNRRAAEKGQAATAAGFATLTSAQQDAVLHDIEETPFFQAVRFDTIVGTFGLPTLGGNRDYVGWRMLGLEHQPAFQAPFGFYDADVNRKG